jgi:hypothetical protein
MLGNTTLVGVVESRHPSTPVNLQNTYSLGTDSLTDRVVELENGKSGKPFIATFHTRLSVDSDAVFRVAIGFNGDTKTNAVIIDLAAPGSKMTGPMSYLLSHVAAADLLREAMIFQKQEQADAKALATHIFDTQGGGVDIDHLLELGDTNTSVKTPKNCCILL